MASTSIEWAEKVWNPIAGCTKVSPGCAHCYAEKMARRLAAMGRPEYEGVTDERGRWTGVLNLASSEKIIAPAGWKKPAWIFVNSMSDLFHPSVPDAWLDTIFEVMEAAHWHTYLVLTKRPDRMAQYTAQRYQATKRAWPKQIILGTSVENQETANERILPLFRTPLEARLFLSMEPLLGPVNLEELPTQDKDVTLDAIRGSLDYVYTEHNFTSTQSGSAHRKLSWVIVGGESGPKARPMNPQWVRDIRDQCTQFMDPQARVNFFFKQWGEWRPARAGEIITIPDGSKKIYRFPEDKRLVFRFGKHETGRELDGQEWSQKP